MLRHFSIFFILIFAFNHSDSQNLTYAWARGLSTSSTDNGYHAVSDSHGYVYSIGHLSFQLVLAKYDSLGNLLWTKMSTGNGSDWGNDISIDDNDNLLIVGYIGGTTFTYGTFTFNGSANSMFIAKLDTGGTVIWAKYASSSLAGNSIATDHSGNSYVTGYFNGPFAVFNQDTVFQIGNEDVFLVKYDPSGNALWVKSFGSPQTDMGKGVACDPSGNVIITGYFSGPQINFGHNTNLINNGLTDVFVVKFDPNGSIIWVDGFGSSADEIGRCICCDGLGNIYIAGNDKYGFYAGSLYVSDIYPGTFDAFVISLTSAGVPVWFNFGGGGGDDNTQGITVDPNFNVYITGSIGPCILAYFGPFALTDSYITTSNIFFAKYDPWGTTVWAKTAGAQGNDGGYGISCRNYGSIYACGTYDGTVIFGSDTLLGIGTNMYTLKLFDNTPLHVDQISSLNDIQLATINGDIYASVSSTESGPMELSVMDISGKTIIKKNIFLNSDFTPVLSCNDHAAGLYLIQFLGRDIGRLVKKVSLN